VLYRPLEVRCVFLSLAPTKRMGFNLCVFYHFVRRIWNYAELSREMHFPTPSTTFSKIKSTFFSLLAISTQKTVLLNDEGMFECGVQFKEADWSLKLISAKTNFSTERPEYRPFSDLRPVPEAGTQTVSGGNRLKITEGPVLRSFSELGFFHFLETVTGWLVPSTTEDPVCWIQVSSGR